MASEGIVGEMVWHHSAEDGRESADIFATGDTGGEQVTRQQPAYWYQMPRNQKISY